MFLYSAVSRDVDMCVEALHFIERITIVPELVIFMSVCMSLRLLSQKSL